MKKKKRPMKLKEIYAEFEEKPETTIRGRIYEHIGDLFQKVARGVYVAIDDEKGSCMIVEGNGRDLSMFKDNSIDAIITDHPWLDKKSNIGGNRKLTSSYQDTSFRYTQEDFNEKARVLKDGHFLVECLPAENENNYEYLYEIKQMAKKAGLEYYALVPWKKGDFVANTGRKAKNTEYMMFFTKGKARKLRPDVKKRKQGIKDAVMSGTAKMLPTMFDYQPPNKKERIHQAEKPSSLFEEILSLITEPGEIVIDQFAGSGAVGEACIKTNRIGILFEILHENVSKIIERLNAQPLSSKILKVSSKQLLSVM